MTRENMTIQARLDRDRYRTPPRNRRTSGRTAPDTFNEPSNNVDSASTMSSTVPTQYGGNRMNSNSFINNGATSAMPRMLQFEQGSTASTFSNIRIPSNHPSEEFLTPRSHASNSPVGTTTSAGSSSRAREFTPPPRNEAQMLMAPKKGANASALENAILKNDVNCVRTALQEDGPNMPMSRRAGYLTALGFAQRIGASEGVIMEIVRAGGQ